MTKLIGTNPNQVPSNADLGTAAFADKEDFLSTRGNALAKITASIGNTPHKTFVYDTKNDSDGGAWRKRTSHTSWYNEKLNTKIRGSRREFPAVVVVIIETTKVTFYDADDSTLPMWMVWEQSGVLTWASGTTTTTISGHLLNAKFLWGTDNRGGGIADFAKDEIELFHGPTASYTLRNPRIGRRYTSSFEASGPYLVGHPSVNDVTMTVLPNALVDPVSKLPIPTMGIAHANGISIIYDDKTIIEKSGSNYYTIDNLGEYFISKSTGDDLSVVPWLDMDTTINYTKGAYKYNGNKSTGYHPYLYGNGGKLIGSNMGQFAQLSGVTGFTRWDINNITNHRDALQCNIKSESTTGWMHGDCRLSVMGDIADTGLMRGDNLLSNPDFTGNLNYWTLVNCTATNTGNALNLTSTASSGHAFTTVEMVAGHDYIISGTVTYGSTFGAGFQVYNGTTTTTPLALSRTGNGSGHYAARYTATVTGSHDIRLYHSVSSGTGHTITYDSISVARGIFDKSTYQSGAGGVAGARVVGAVKKQKVAPGADLVSYTIADATSRLEIPENGIHQFGTDVWSFTGWVKSRSTTNYSDIIARGNVGSVGWPSSKTGSWFLQLKGAASSPVPARSINLYYKTASTLVGSGWSSIGLPYDEWAHVVVKRTKAEIRIYINGEVGLAAEIQATHDFSISGADHEDTVKIGWQGSSYNFPSVDEEFALFRLSHSAPTDEQILKSYHDEKSLFEPNAKAGVYGTVDSVTQADYDSSTGVWHVGTTDGRSDFKGLKRINNTTKAVGKIAAEGGLIVD